jgi:hypothetical protein
LPGVLQSAEVQDQGTRDAIRAWNLMDGELKWESLDLLAEWLGIEDVETWLARLVFIRKAQRSD